MEFNGDGYENNPQIMQRTVNKILEGVKGKRQEIYINDTVKHTFNEFAYIGLFKAFYIRNLMYI